MVHGPSPTPPAAVTSSSAPTTTAVAAAGPAASAEADAVVSAVGYRRSILRSLLWFVCALLSGGVLLLVGYWRPTLRLWATHVPCELRHATSVLVKRHTGQQSVEPLLTARVESGEVTRLVSRDAARSSANGSVFGARRGALPDSADRKLLGGDDAESDPGGVAEVAALDATAEEAILAGAPLTFFEHRHLRYVWAPASACFCRVHGDDVGLTLQQLHQRAMRVRGR